MEASIPITTIEATNRTMLFFIEFSRSLMGRTLKSSSRFDQIQY